MRSREAIESLFTTWLNVYKQTGSAAAERNAVYWHSQLLEIDNA